MIFANLPLAEENLESSISTGNDSLKSIFQTFGWELCSSVEWKKQNVEFQKITMTESCLMVGTRKPMKNF